MTTKPRRTDAADPLLSSVQPTAKRLILSVLSQPNMSHLTIRQLVAWGDLFDQKPAAIRVTAGRLVKDDLLQKTGRGMYTMGPQGLALKNKASEWTHVLDLIQNWEGGWISVHTAHLGKAVRRHVRTRQRAFRLLGFQELVEGLWIRPDNLIFSDAEIFEKLCQLGLQPSAVLLSANHLQQRAQDNPFTLWSSEVLNAGYDHAAALLQQSQDRLTGKDMRAVTRETFIIGEHVIRQINADPLLPAQHIDGDKRETMVRAMQRYSDFCHPYWAEFLGAANAPNP